MTPNAARAAHKSKNELLEEIVGRLVRRHSSAAVLFHHAIAERLGLGPTDHKCFDLLRERGAMTGSELAAITGLTSGAITGVVARLERAGYLRRQPDPHDRRQQFLHPTRERRGDIQAVFDPLRKDAATLLEQFDAHQLAAVAKFLAGTTDLIYRHAALLRAQETLSHEPDFARFAEGTTANKAQKRTRKGMMTTHAVGALRE